MRADELKKTREAALREAAEAQDTAALEDVRIKYLSRKGLLQEVMKGLKDLDPAERPEVGRLANELKNDLQNQLESRRADLEKAAGEDRKASFDHTLPGRWRGVGSRHPISQITERAVEIFHALGFTVAEGPDVETVHNNFDALNTPENHPSRDPQDTFYLESGDLLRCHTSPVQVRYMESHHPPVRVVAPGRCYRRDTPDATHSANFHQIEGLYVDKDVSLADLKGDIAYFAHELMGPEVDIRFRPHFFPFTEPSVEVDFTCHVCGGKGCRVCKGKGWIEIMGAGMVDPNVFKAVGYDPDAVTGYAFGMGIERIAMVLYGIKDIRLLYENDIRYLRQF
jgi:phenylalanyl-tRNA synthetase alpha chain